MIATGMRPGPLALSILALAGVVIAPLAVARVWVNDTVERRRRKQRQRVNNSVFAALRQFLGWI
ncbi:MAG: hypothetical protein JWL96_1221 [Sphingomonas bacterium]|nr:hypothetical protein [Sphingomonas bacterium]